MPMLSTCVVKVMVRVRVVVRVRVMVRVRVTNADAQHVCVAFASIAVAPSAC